MAKDLVGWERCRRRRVGGGLGGWRRRAIPRKNPVTRQRVGNSSTRPPFFLSSQPTPLAPLPPPFPPQEDVDKLRGSLLIQHTLATRGAEKLWELCSEEPFVPALGALTGGQAVQSVRAGLKAIYCSGA